MAKRVLMITNYFYPEVASVGQLMTELCEELQHHFEITVIAAFPNYTGKVPEQYKGKLICKEKHQNIDILRVKVPEFNKRSKLSRIKYIVSYFFNCVYAILISGKQDIVFSVSQPPILGGLLGVTAKIAKKAKFIYNIQDFNPEQTEVVSYFKSKFIIELARKVDKLSCKISNSIVIVGRDMRDTLKKRFNDKIPNNIVINNWIDEKSVYPLDCNHPKVIEFKRKHGLNDKVVIMYSGNIGLFYDLENIIKVIGDFKDRENIVFAFVGEGAVKDSLVSYCTDNSINNVKFIPYQNKKDLVYSLNAADFHLVINAKGIKGVSVPSKVYGVLAVNKPIIGVLEEGSEARTIIEESGCGYCCKPGEYETLKSIINLIITNKHNKELYKGRDYLEKHLTKDKSICKYIELFYCI